MKIVKVEPMEFISPELAYIKLKRHWPVGYLTNMYRPNRLIFMTSLINIRQGLITMQAATLYRPITNCIILYRHHCVVDHYNFTINHYNVFDQYRHHGKNKSHFYSKNTERLCVKILSACNVTFDISVTYCKVSQTCYISDI